MAHIKSALELALERTKDIAGDKGSLKAKTLKEEGMRILTSIIEQPDFDAAAKLETFDPEDRAQVRDGLFQVLLQRIKLPATELAIHDLPAIERGLTAVLPKKAPIKGLAEELAGIYKQYIADKKQLFDAVVEQYTPVLRQKEQQLAAQTGQRVRLTPEQDPEFQKFLKKNLDHMDENYNTGLNQLKDQVQQLYSGGKA